MKGLKLFFSVACATLLSASFVSCSDDEEPITPPPPVKEPSVTVTAGVAAETTLSFTITPENAEQCAYICVEKTQTVPAAEEILASAGTQVSAAEATTVEVTDLAPETEYVIVAAASDGKKAVLSESITMTTLEKGAVAIAFDTASAGVYTGNATLVFTEATDTYQLSLDFYYDSSSRVLPAGTYTIGSGSAPGMVDNNPSYTFLWLKKEGETPLPIASGTVTVAIDENNAYDIAAVLVTDQGEFTATYKGDIEGISFVYDITSSAAKRIEPNNELPGEYYLKLNDADWKFEMVLDLYADPTSTTLPAGTYTVGADKTPGTVGPASCIDIYSPYSNDRFSEGTVVVTKEGNTYTLDMNLVGESGLEFSGTFTGEIADMERAPKVTEIAMDKAVAGVYTGNATITFTEQTNAYQLSLDFYYDSSSRVLPAGTYTIGSGSTPGMIDNTLSYTYLWLRNESQTPLALSGTVTVAIVNDAYDIVAELTTDQGDFKVTYKGDIEGISFTYDITSAAAKRIEPNNELPGEYYLKLNDADWKFEMVLDLYAATDSTTLPEGTYTVGADKTPGTIGPASGIDIYSPYSNDRFSEGTVVVTKAGNVYTLDMNLVGESGLKLSGTFTGEIADMARN